MKRLMIALALAVGATAILATGGVASADPAPGACTLSLNAPAKIAVGSDEQQYVIGATGCDGLLQSADVAVLGNSNRTVDSLFYTATNSSSTLTLFPQQGGGAQILHPQLADSDAYLATTCTDPDLGTYACDQQYTVSLAAAPIDVRYRSASTLNGHRVGNTVSLNGYILQYSESADAMVPYRATARIERWNGSAWKLIGSAYPDGHGHFSYTRVDPEHYRYRVETIDSPTVWAGISRALSF